MQNLLYLLIFGFSSLSVQAQETITLATTTSTDNSGLLEYLLPKFKAKYQVNIKVISTGTGKALRLAETGDVDLVLVHAPAKEKQLVKSGAGINRQSLMYNHFLIVGPAKDPANITNAKTAQQAINKIFKAKSKFISRADESGTHIKELQIWHNANINTKGSWYLEVGQGMAKTLQIADEFDAYTLIDAGTWLKLKSRTKLKLLFFGDPIMFNPYSVILVNPQKHQHAKYRSAQILAAWLTSKHTKDLINNYKVANQQLFFAE